MPKLIDMLSQEEIDNIIDMYQSNISLREIEKRTHHGRPQITRMLEDLGVKTTKGNHYRKYFFDFDFFSVINSDLKAYWLGFLYADGSISTPRYGEQCFKLSLQSKDQEILEKMQQDFHSTYPLRFGNSKRLSTGEISQLVTLEQRSQKTVNDLKRLGCVERKSLILTFPEPNQVSPEYIYSFIRGYFDGDGSIGCYKGNYILNFTGTEQFIKKLALYFNGGSVFPDKRKINSWYFNLNGNLQIIQAYHLLYDNAQRYLLRKYNKFQELLSKYPEREGTKV